MTTIHPEAARERMRASAAERRDRIRPRQAPLVIPADWTDVTAELADVNYAVVGSPTLGVLQQLECLRRHVPGLVPELVGKGVPVGGIGE
jgi:hypothetical protein